jgi:hypothetical protein
MNEPIIRKRKRRRIGNSDDISLNLTTELSYPTTDAQPNSDHAPPSKPETTISPRLSDLDCISLIRSELLEDDYHSTLAESDYWDDSHSWSNGDELLCDDYWHFLGRYE